MEPNVKKITAKSKAPVDEKLEDKRLSLRSQQQLSSLQEKILHPEEQENADGNAASIRAELLAEVEGLISSLEWYCL